VLRKVFCWTVVAVSVALTFTSSSMGAEAEPCFDFEDALTTAIDEEPALAGGTLEVVINRKAADVDTPITGLVVVVDDEAMPIATVPGVGEELRVAVPVSDADSVVIEIGWQQGPSATDPFACGGYDRARIAVHPSKAGLSRYISRVARAQSAWNRHLRSRAVCVDDLKKTDPASLRAAARCLDRARVKDRSLRLYRTIDPPRVLRKVHRGLVASAALRVTWEKVAANTFRRAARFFERPSFYFAEPAVPTGIQANRARWREALVREAEVSGATVPLVLRRVGTEAQF